MISLCNKEQCTGCEACINVCPKDAIRINKDLFGFGYPSILETKCIQCGKCVQTCPILKRPAYQSPKVAYTYSGSLEFRKNCSSGGLVARLIEYCFKKGYYIAGVIFEDDFLAVKYVVTRDWTIIEKMRKSKYIAAKVGNVYAKTKSLLENGKHVLFIGLPCHISALKNIVKNEDNLITVDLMCHGNGSPEIYKESLKSYCKKKGYQITNIKGVDFRPKPEPSRGKKFFSINVDGNIDKMISDEFPYCFGFSNRLLLRESCVACQFHTIERVADITAGDSTFGYDEYGSTVILQNTVKGERLINEIWDKHFLKVENEQWPVLEKRFEPKVNSKNCKRIRRCTSYERMERTFLNFKWVPLKSKIKRLIVKILKMMR